MSGQAQMKGAAPSRSGRKDRAERRPARRVGRKAAVRVAHTRLVELRNVARVLWPDRDDPRVMSELVVVMREIRAAEQTVCVRGSGRS
jgi:hypothetical protein